MQFVLKGLKSEAVSVEAVEIQGNITEFIKARAEVSKIDADTVKKSADTFIALMKDIVSTCVSASKAGREEVQSWNELKRSLYEAGKIEDEEDEEDEE